MWRDDDDYYDYEGCGVGFFWFFFLLLTMGLV